MEKNSFKRDLHFFANLNNLRKFKVYFKFPPYTVSK